MKLSKILIVAAASCMMLSSCYDLDRYPDDQLAGATFYQTDAHAKAAMMGVYTVMRWDHVYGYAFAWDGLGGISAGYDNQSMVNIQKGTLSQSNSYYTTKWGYCYEGIARANDVLRNVDKLQESDEIKDRYRAEARFMRAVYYWHLFKFYGGVPLYDESWNVATDYDKMLEPRATEEATRKFILDDIEAALALPESWPAADNGRATWGAAMSFKGKVLLFNKQYKEASECFKEVINSGLYQLNASYADLFQPAADACSEMIFSIQNLGGVGKDLGMPLCFHLGTNSAFGYSWNNCMASCNFANEYEWKDGRPFDWADFITDLTGDYSWSNIRKVLRSKTNDSKNKVTEYTPYKQDLIDMYNDRDPRMNASLITPYSHYTGGCGNKEIDYEFVILSDMNVPAQCGILKCNSSAKFYPWRKFVPVGIMGGAINNRAHTPINFPLIRYADVLLMQAECLNELGDQTGACSLINQVRTRKSVNMPALNSGPAWLVATTHDQVFERIRHERRIELACEGHSFDDMRRWGLLEELDGVYEDELDEYKKKSYQRKVTKRDYLWPIPLSEIDKNPNLKQNPDW